MLVKSGLLLVLAGLGAFNRFRSIPTVRATAVRLRRVGTVELAVAAVILVATAVLQNLAPARTASAAALSAAARPIVVSGSDFGTTTITK